MEYLNNKPLLTDGQQKLSTEYRSIIADMNRSKTIVLDNGTKVLTYAYDDKHSAPMLTEGACFQPMQQNYDFSKGIVRNEEGKYMFDSNGKAIMERDLAIAHRSQYKQQCKDTYGENWKKVFYHGHI